MGTTLEQVDAQLPAGEDRSDCREMNLFATVRTGDDSQFPGCQPESGHCSGGDEWNSLEGLGSGTEEGDRLAIAKGSNDRSGRVDHGDQAPML